MRTHYLIAFVCSIFSHSLLGDTWSSPTVQELESSNGEWSAQVIPSQRYYNQKQADRAKAVLTSGDDSKEFSLLNVWAPSHAFLLNDGRLLTIDNWGNLGGGDEVAALYDSSGKVLWNRTLDELVDIETRRGAMMTTSSIWWKKQPLEWQLDEAETKFTLTLHNENKLEITLADGSSRTIEVVELGDDPQRLLDRGLGYLRTSDYAEAEAHLKRSIELSPTSLEAYRGLARTYKQQLRHADTVEALADIREVFKDFKQPHNLANLYCDLANAYHQLDKFAEEEAILRDAMALKTDYTYPLIRLAENLEAQDQTSAVAPLFKAFYALNSDKQHGLQWIVRDIGDYYAGKGRHRAAIQWYLKVEDREGLNKTLLYFNLAKSYEALGQTDDAVGTYQRLIVEEKAAGKGSYYIDQAERDIARIISASEE